MSCSLCLTIQSQKRDSKAYHKTEPFFAELRIAFTGNDRPNLNCLFVCLFLNSLWEWVAFCVSLYKVKIVIARPITKQSLSLQSWKWLSLAMTERTWTVCLFLNSLWEWVPLCVSLYQVKSVIARPITNRSFLCRVGNSFSWQWRTEPELFVCLFVWLFVSEFSEVKSTIARPIRAFIWKVLNSFH